MENRAYALTVGVFTLLVGSAMVFAFWWFAGRGDATYDITLYTESSVGGLNPQAAVRFRGIRAGRVTDIEIDPRNPRRILVQVRLAIDAQVTRATRARLATQGLTGFVFVQLDDDGSDPTPIATPAGPPPQIALDTGPGNLMDVAADVLVKVKQVAERLALVLDDTNRQQIRTSLQHLASASVHLDAALAKTPALLGKADRVMARLDSNKIDQTLAHLEQGTANLPAAVADLRKTLTEVQALTRRWESLGADVQTRLLNDGGGQAAQTLDELHRLSGDLSALINSLERNPQSVVFGRRPPAPGPGETGYRAPPPP